MIFSDKRPSLPGSHLRKMRYGAGLMLALGCVPAFALLTGTWSVTNTNSSGIGTNTVNGITTTVSGYTGQNPSYTGGSGSTFNSTNYWQAPYGGTVAGGPSLQVNLPFGFQAGTQITVNFNKPVDNPVIHVDRMGGLSQSQNGAIYANSSRWTLSGSSSKGGAVTLTQLSGNPQFQVNANSFQRMVTDGAGNNVVVANSAECTTTGPSGTNAGTACGSIRFNGTGISSLTFTVDPVGFIAQPAGIGDGMEIGFSFPGSNVTIKKQSNGGTNSFPFTLGNLTGSNPTLNTASANPASSTAFPVNDHSQAITISESAVAGYNLASATCTDANGTNVPSTLNAGSRQLTIAAADYGTDQAITCTFNNDKQPILRLQKQVPNGRSSANDQFTLDISGAGGPANATTSGSGTTATGTATLSAGTVGSTYTLSESGASGANLSNYTTTYTCTNAYANGSPNVNGTASNFSLIPKAGDDFTCVFVNTRKPHSDLTITKNDGINTAYTGHPVTYQIVVGNNGPDPVTGAVVKDPQVSGLSCKDPVPCSGSACPQSTVALSDLQGNGVVLGQLANGASVTLSLTCTPQ